MENRGVFGQFLNKKEKIVPQKETLGVARPQAKMRKYIKGVGFKTVHTKKETEATKKDSHTDDDTCASIVSHDLTAISHDLSFDIKEPADKPTTRYLIITGTIPLHSKCFMV